MDTTIKWVTDSNSNHHELILLFDLMAGLHLGFYDAFSGRYFTKERIPLDMVAGWVPIPEIPKFDSTIKENKRSISGRLVVKIKEEM